MNNKRRLAHRLAVSLFIIHFSLFILITSCSPRVLTPPAPAASYATATNTQPPVLKTTLPIPLTMSLAALERQVNASLGEILYEDKSLDDNGGDNLMLTVRKRAPIKITGSGQVLQFRVPIKVWAKAGYRVDKFGLTVGKYEDTEFALDALFSSKITAGADYRLRTQTSSNGYEWIQKPTIALGFIKIPITSVVDHILEKQLPGIAKATDAELAKTLNLREDALKAWRLIQEPVLVNPEYKAWVTLRPQALLLDGPTITNEMLSGTLALEALAQTRIGAKPAIAAVADMPPLRLGRPASPDFFVALPAQLPWAEAQMLAMQQLKGKIFEFQEGKRKIEITALELYGQGEQMVIGATLAGSLEGKVYLKGRPVYDVNTESISLTNADFDLQTRNRVAKLANYLLHGELVQRMAPYLTLSVKDQMDAARKAIKEGLAQNKLRPDVELKGVLNEMKLQDLKVTADGLEVVVNATGRLAVEVK